MDKKKGELLLSMRKTMNRRVISDRRLDAVFDTISRHPYLVAAFICFALTGFGCYSYEFVNGFTVYGVFALLELVWFRRLLRHLDDSGKHTIGSVLIFAAKSLLALAAVNYFVHTEYKASFVCFVGLAAVLVLYVVLLNNDRKFYDKVKCLALAGAGFVLRYSYVFMSDIYTRQNDVWYFGGEGGHAGYIEYIYNNNALPDFDPTTLWQYYHPPLHHIICAVWLKFCTIFGIEYYMACEAIQALTLFYVCAVTITVYKILRLFDLKGKALTIPFGMCCMYPYLVLMSGGINNDPLMLCFTVGAIYCVFRWYREQTAKNIVKAALCIGLGMMTKLSVGLCAPAVLILFIMALVQNRKHIVNRLGQLCLFGVICCSLGLWWSVRNFLRFGVKPTYVPSLSENDSQYIGYLTTKQRLTDFSFFQFKKVFEQWGGESYKEYNPTIAALKNSLFGEGINESHFPKTATLVPYALFWIALILAVISFVAMVIVLFAKTDNARFTEKLMLTVIYATVLGNYYNFCIRYPFICTMNFRYIIPCMLIGLINIGLFTNMCQQSKKAPCKTAVNTISWLSSAFVVLSYMTYFFVASSNG